MSDCGADGKGVFSFRGLGGAWLVIFNGRCGVVLDPGMANMWRRGGEKRHDAPDGRSLAVVIPCAGRGFRGKVLSLVSVYAPVSGAGFDQERRVMFDCLSSILGLLPFRSVWLVGGDFNAEVGFRGVGEETTLGGHAHGRRTRTGRQLVEYGLWERTSGFFCLSQDNNVGILGIIPRAGLAIRLIIFFVGQGIIGFWAPRGFCLRIRWVNPGLPIRIIIRLKLGWPKVGSIVLPRELPASCVDPIGCCYGVLVDQRRRRGKLWQRS